MFGSPNSKKGIDKPNDCSSAKKAIIEDVITSILKTRISLFLFLNIMYEHPPNRAEHLTMQLFQVVEAMVFKDVFQVIDVIGDEIVFFFAHRHLRRHIVPTAEEAFAFQFGKLVVFEILIVCFHFIAV